MNEEVECPKCHGKAKRGNLVAEEWLIGTNDDSTKGIASNYEIDCENCGKVILQEFNQGSERPS
jgi:hypothetical protein